jgi:hypothetical protein
MIFHPRLIAFVLSASVVLAIVRDAHADKPPPPPLPPPPTKVDASASVVVTPGVEPSSTPVATAAPSAAPVEDPSTSSSVRMTYEATHVDRPGGSASEPKKRTIDDSVLLHGFRLGYGHVMNYDSPTEAFGGKSLKEQTGIRRPHHFLLGYEVMYRVVSHSWLNVLLLGNAMIAGIEQSKFLPSGNLLIGAEINNSFQVGVGANLSPLKGSEAHVVTAAGWTPRVGSIYTPFHVYFIPDVDGVHRMGVTTGVTF